MSLRERKRKDVKMHGSKYNTRNTEIRHHQNETLFVTLHGSSVSQLQGSISYLMVHLPRLLSNLAHFSYWYHENSSFHRLVWYSWMYSSAANRYYSEAFTDEITSAFPVLV